MRARDQHRLDASYLLRSELRVQTCESNHIEELRRLLTQPRIDARATMFLGYALGKQLDDLERFDEARASRRDIPSPRRCVSSSIPDPGCRSSTRAH